MNQELGNSSVETKECSEHIKTAERSAEVLEEDPQIVRREYLVLRRKMY
jgi:hypothetical protein